MPDPSIRIGGRLVAWPMFVLSIGIAVAVIRPFAEAPVGFDTQATVAYFDRIVSGVRLEQALSTTPKPALTIVYGLLHSLTGDWRPIVWATILAYAAAAALAAGLAARAVGLAAAVAAGLVVAGLPLLIEDTAFGNAVPWALVGWFSAGLLAMGARPRPGLAGLALALAALCRLETLVIVATVGIALLLARFGPWPLTSPRSMPPARSWLIVAIPFLALPIMLIHDWLLTGDPFFWVHVSERYSAVIRETGTVLGPVERTTWFVRRYLQHWPAVLLALTGIAALVGRRRWGELVGLTGMGPGIAAFVILLAARGLYAPERYVLPVDLTLALLAAVGFGALVSAVAARWGRSALGRAVIIGGSVGVVVVVAVATRAGPFDPDLVPLVDDVRALNEHTARVTPLLRETAGDDLPDGGIGWLVPTAVRPRVAVDLDVPLTSVGGLSRRWLDPASADFAVGQLVFHDLRGDLPRGEYGALEADGEVTIGEAILSPRLIDPAAGFWLRSVTSAP